LFQCSMMVLVLVLALVLVLMGMVLVRMLVLVLVRMLVLVLVELPLPCFRLLSHSPPSSAAGCGASRKPPRIARCPRQLPAAGLQRSLRPGVPCLERPVGGVVPVGPLACLQVTARHALCRFARRAPFRNGHVFAASDQSVSRIYLQPRPPHISCPTCHSTQPQLRWS
jgi:hypothetical protein